jgi:hypothetical protein
MTPDSVVANDGDEIRFCNKLESLQFLFSYSRYNRFGDTHATTLRLNPGSCGTVTVHNPTDKPLKILLKSEISSSAHMWVVVTPAVRCAQAVAVGCPPQKPPSRLTLTVNGTTGVATTTDNSIHITAPKVAPNSNLAIKAMLDLPLPRGWTMVVFHNGDPKSQGNGVWYQLCDLTGSATPSAASASAAKPPECADTRPTLPSPGDDFVGAQVRSPTGFSLYIQIYVPVG